MPLKIFELGELQLASKNSKKLLLLTCSVTLDLPISLDEDLDIDGLAERSRTGQLWISKGTVCRMEIAACVAGAVEASGSLLRCLVESVAGCSVSVSPSCYPQTDLTWTWRYGKT